MKKILFITPQNPEPSDAGDKKYSWDVLLSIKHKDEVYLHVVSFYSDDEKKYSYHKLDKLADKVTYVPFKSKKPWEMALSFYPAFIANRRTKAMIECVQNILNNENFDVIIVNMFKMSYLISEISHYPGKKIHLSHNVEYQVAQSIYQNTNSIINKIAYFLDYYKTKYWERYFLSKFDAVTTCCDYDAELLGMLKGVPKPVVIRSIVNVTPFEKLHEHSNNIIICGSFKWLPKIINIQNVIRCNNIKLLKKSNKHLLVVGNADEVLLKEGNSIDNVKFTGYVNSVSPYYDDSEVALIPEYAGGGFKQKIAEAVQNHMPIVAIKGSITYNQMIAGVHYIEAEDFDDLLLKGIKLCDDRKKQEELVKNITSLFADISNIETIHKNLRNVMYNE